MSTLREISAEIHSLTGKMIEIGLASDQNYPSENSARGEAGPIVDLTVSKGAEISTALKNQPYSKLYETLSTNRAYNIKFIDGALVQFRYRFSGGNLIKHVLAFYPSPTLLEFQNEPELYEDDILYADIVRKDVVTTPIRFDYDPAAFVENVHPISHFTIGQYKNCRIAVSSALTPFRFLDFILRAFYNTPYLELCSDVRGTARDFPRTATVSEANRVHLSF